MVARTKVHRAEGAFRVARRSRRLRWQERGQHAAGYEHHRGRGVGTEIGERDAHYGIVDCSDLS